MGRDWKKWAMDKGLQKWFRRDNFLILVLTGILLIIIALPTEEKKEQEDSPVLETEKQTEENSKTNNRDSQEQSGQTADADALYAARMEERLTQALSRVAGVGEVQVMITLKASSELVVEKEQPVRRSSTNESDGDIRGERDIPLRREPQRALCGKDAAAADRGGAGNRRGRRERHSEPHYRGNSPGSF